MITKEESEAKSLRLDKAIKAAHNRETVEIVRITGFNAFFKGIHNSKNIKKLILEHNENMSKIQHLRSYFIWLYFYDIIQDNKPFPDLSSEKIGNFFRNCYTVGIGNEIKDKSIQSCYNKYLEYFKTECKLPENLGNIVTHAANTYIACFIRHFCNIDNVLNRIKRYIKLRIYGYLRQTRDDDIDDFEDKYIALEDCGDNPINNILNALQDSAYNTKAMHLKQVELLNEIKEEFGMKPNVNMTNHWLRKNIEKSIVFTLKTVKNIDELKELTKDLEYDKIRKGALQQKKFVPLNNLQRSFITIDTTDLAKILKLECDKSLYEEAVRGTFYKNINEIFRSKKYSNKPSTITENTYYFTGTIDTDGVSVHAHFRKK